MQISDEMIAFRNVFLRHEKALPDLNVAQEAVAAYVAALSLPVQPVADAEPAGFFVLAEPGFKPFFCRSREDAEHTADNYRKYVHGCTRTSIDPLYRTPPVPPTKGPEDDLIAALEVATNALEGLSYIHDGNPSDAMADTPPLEYARHMLYEARQIAKEAVCEVLALRSRPASALPVVGEAGKLAPGCCSAISPCSHQRHDPRSICDTCRAALTPTVQP